MRANHDFNVNELAVIILGITIDDPVPADVSAVVVPTIHQTLWALWEQQWLPTPLSIVSAIAVVTIQQTTRDRETLPA